MTEKFKHIHIGKQIKEIAKIKDLSISRACKYLKCTVKDIEDMYGQKSLDTSILLKWCKLLDYNFFMYYHSHLQLYKASASRAVIVDKSKKEVNEAYTFRKNFYSPEIIDWLVGKMNSKELKPNDIITKYKVPRTTVYRWLKKQKIEKAEKPSKKKAQIDYKGIYLDYLEELPVLSDDVKTDIKKDILQWKEKVPFRTLESTHIKIRNGLSDKSYKSRYQRVKAFDSDYIKYILKHQASFGLSDIEISHQFELSRGTIAKWNKLFKET